jgi:NADPH:quinone reductase-like Zn-dependent oxidoreductase
MLSVYAASVDLDDPLSGLVVGERPEPTSRPGWATVTVKAPALDQHDILSLRGVALEADRVPMILGTSAVGIDEDGNEVIVPSRNLIPKPPELSFEQAACLPTAWLTAYRMLFTCARVTPGQTVLVQGASGGVATALITLASNAGIRVWATSRTEPKRALAISLGAEAAFEPGAQLPEHVDAVMDTTGAAAWQHSLRSLTRGGVIVTSGAVTGDGPPADLTSIFIGHLSVIASSMGTHEEFERMLRLDRQLWDSARDRSNHAAVRSTHRARGSARGRDRGQDRAHGLIAAPFDAGGSGTRHRPTTPPRLAAPWSAPWSRSASFERAP